MIEHLGKTFKTKHFDKILTDRECDIIRNNFFNKPLKFDVLQEMSKLKNGKLQIGKIYNYYFYELAADCKIKGMKWSIKEFLQCNDLLRFASGKFKNNSKFYIKLARKI